MAATAAAKNKAIRQKALREQLSAQGHVQHVIEISEKLSEQALTLESSHIQAYKASADIKLKLINKYLPDLKAVEMSVEGNIGLTDLSDEELTRKIQLLEQSCEQG